MNLVRNSTNGTDISFHPKVHAPIPRKPDTYDHSKFRQDPTLTFPATPILGQLATASPTHPQRLSPAQDTGLRPICVEPARTSKDPLSSQGRTTVIDPFPIRGGEWIGPSRLGKSLSTHSSRKGQNKAVQPAKRTPSLLSSCPSPAVMKSVVLMFKFKMEPYAQICNL